MASLTVNGIEYELKVTMHRLKLLREYTGVDLLNPKKGGNNGEEEEGLQGQGPVNELASAEGLIAAVYAFAGGEKIGVPLDEFADAIAPSDLPVVNQALMDTFQRDFGQQQESDSGNVAGSASNG
jgi:hypothetical protein